MELDVQLAILADRAYDRHSGRVKELEYLLDTVNGQPTIAIRGTEGGEFYKDKNWRDIVRDLRAIPWCDKDVGWAHAGMLKGARRLFKHLHIGSITPPDKTVYVTGHSLGAGVGFILAKLIHNRVGLPVEFVGFGCPNIMVSDPTVPFPTRFYVNGDDIVPRLLGRVFYKKFNHIQVGDRDGFEPIDDHTDMDEYVTEVERYLAQQKELSQV